MPVIYHRYYKRAVLDRLADIQTGYPIFILFLFIGIAINENNSTSFPGNVTRLFQNTVSSYVPSVRLFLVPHPDPEPTEHCKAAFSPTIQPESTRLSESTPRPRLFAWAPFTYDSRQPDPVGLVTFSRHRDKLGTWVDSQIRYLLLLFKV
ncbi:uncharacterized protein F4822DRAFT_241346 [Hypoxylon trugodes]|uniref:uncharacterized protein n=1 Tax=Hypoxylon trugodes TaxID=326681 RepID=UPI0021900CEB|nr:uncharacterized protein F4822DRAFT_241346 [Hypoxylon trugodes]KAI1388301.1 hypothetical protein F4822DRAFT_241346 [Hypoxylon trugodes]